MRLSHCNGVANKIENHPHKRWCHCSCRILSISNPRHWQKRLALLPISDSCLGSVRNHKIKASLLEHCLSISLWFDLACFDASYKTWEHQYLLWYILDVTPGNSFDRKAMRFWLMYSTTCEYCGESEHPHRVIVQFGLLMANCMNSKRKSILLHFHLMTYAIWRTSFEQWKCA